MERGEFHGFLVIRVSQGSVPKYVSVVNVYIALYNRFPAEFVSERVLKIGQDLRKLLPKVWGLGFLEHSECIFGIVASLVISPALLLLKML